MAMFLKVKADRVSSCRGTRFLSSPEPTPRARNRTPNRMIRSVTTSQTIVDARIRKPSALFRFSNPNDSIHFQNVSHFNRYRTPQYAKNTMAMRQTIWTKSGVFAAGPLRRSQIASAAAKRKGQEDIQLSLESIYSVQRALPSHWEMALLTFSVRTIPHVFTVVRSPSARSVLSVAAGTSGSVPASTPSVPVVLARWAWQPLRSPKRLDSRLASVPLPQGQRQWVSPKRCRTACCPAQSPRCFGDTPSRSTAVRLRSRRCLRLALAAERYLRERR